MNRIFLLGLWLLLLLVPSNLALAQEGDELAITSPRPGQVIQGLEIITGTVGILGFSSYELAFAYSGDESGTWFPIQTSSQPVYDGSLGTWDTTVLTDGDYDLRLHVSLLDGTEQELLVPGVRLRNYTAAPTEVPTATPTEFASLIVPTARFILTELPTATPAFPTPTALPANPVTISRGAILAAIGRGALLAVLAILLLVVVLRPKKS